MQWLVGFFLLCMIIKAMGIWFWILAILLGAGGAYLYWAEESSLTEEEKAERRRRNEEREHKEQMMRLERVQLRRRLAIEAEHHKQQQRSTALNGVGGMVAKAGLSLAIHALTGGNHPHHHRH